MDNAGTRELIVVLVVMIVLFLFGLLAAILFYRQYLKEKRNRGKK